MDATLKPACLTLQSENIIGVTIHTLLKKIKDKEAIISIIGLGYVGLPLSFAFLDKGFRVIGLDTDKSKINSLSNGKSYLEHITFENLPQHIQDKSFTVSVDFSEISLSDVIIICVPTPLNKFREPDLTPVIHSASVIKDFLKEGQMVILESSTYPGTTDEVLANELEKSGLRSNDDFYLAYSPEREDPGNKNFNTTTIPKVVGADTTESRELSYNLYKQVIADVITVSSSRTAEATKLTENIFRCVNIALVNELKTIYDVMDIDVWEVIDAASTKPFGYMPFYPGPGLGGHCIPIDPFYLTYKAREYEVPTKFIELAGEINTSMPHFVMGKVVNAMSDKLGKAINGSKILIIGMAYKNDIDDIRESPALTLFNLLDAKGAKVSYHDDFVPEIRRATEFPLLNGMKSIPLTEKTIKDNDLVLIITNHTYIDFKLIAEHAKLIVDTRNAMSGIEAASHIIKA